VKSLLSSLLVVALSALASAQTPAFNIVKPSTTGIPGEELRVMKFDPQGNLWVAGRAPFWGESGVAMLPAAQVPYEALPGGGFDTGAWRVWSSVQNPLLTAFISGMEFGADGTIWLGTGSIDLGGGLIRFRPDAATPEEMWFKYDSHNSPLLLDGIRSLDMAPDGRLWMVNGEVNSSPAVFSFDPASGAWQEFDMGQELPWPGNFNLVNHVHAGLSGHVWVSHASLSGLAEYDGSSWTLHAGGSQFDRLLEDQQGNVWATTGLAGLWKWNGSTYKHWSPIGGTGTTTGLGLGDDGTVWVGTWYGPVFRMLNDVPVFFADADALPYHFAPRPNGEIWIGNYGGNGVSGTARHYTAQGQLLERINTWNSGLPDYFVDRILADTTGNVWFATGEAGLSRMLGSDGAPDQPTHWRNWGNHNDQAEPYPWAGNEPMVSMLDTGGTVWMGGNGVGRWDEESGSFTGFWNWQNAGLSVDEINDIARDAHGDVWIASDGSGAWRFDVPSKTWKHHSFSTGPYSYSQERIFTLATDHDGLLWAGAEFGLHTFDGTTWTNLSLDVPFNAFGVHDIEVGPNGDVWVCTDEGLARWNGATWSFYTQQNSGLIGKAVRDVSIRGDGLVGVASFSFFPDVGGVSTFDGPTWTKYTTANSPLTHFQCEAVQFDSDGDLWASPMSEGVVEILLGKTQGAGTWSDLGLGLKGVTGHVPHLAGSGTLKPGSSNTLALSGAAPLAPAWLVGGLQVRELAFKGGTLVPQPQFAALLQTSPAGALSLSFTWPASAPPGTQLVLQAWIQDGAAVKGFAASNGLLAASP
jgi:hypothetical protein